MVANTAEDRGKLKPLPLNRILSNDERSNFCYGITGV